MSFLSTDIPTLLHVPWHRSSMPFQVVLELEIPSNILAIKEMSIDELRNEPGLETITPRRIVPVMALPDKTSILECGAIIMHILEKFDSRGRMHPLANDSRRPLFLQGMFYASNAYHTLRLVIIHSDGDSKGQKEKLEVAIAECKRVIVEHLEWVLENGKGRFYIGDQFSAVDVMFGYLFMCWEQCLAVDYGSEKVKKYVDRLKVRRSYQHLYCEDDTEAQASPRGHGDHDKNGVESENTKKDKNNKEGPESKQQSE